MSTRDDCHSISDFMLTISFFMPDRKVHCHLDALDTLLSRSIRPSFVDFVLLFSFHYETAAKAKENGS